MGDVYQLKSTYDIIRDEIYKLALELQRKYSDDPTIQAHCIAIIRREEAEREESYYSTGGDY